MIGTTFPARRRHWLTAIVATVVMCLILHPVTGFAAGGTLPACANSRFQDVQKLAQYCAAVHLLADNSIVDGYGDGSFRPSQAITRAEFAKLFVAVMGLDPRPDLPAGFSDVRGHWAADLGYIQAAVQADAIAGFPDGTFRPDVTVTRAQAIKIASAWALVPGEADAFTANIPAAPTPPGGAEPPADPGGSGDTGGSGGSGIFIPDLRLPPYFYFPINPIPGPTPPIDLLNPQPLPPTPPPDVWITLPKSLLSGSLLNNPVFLNPQPLPPKELSTNLILANPGMFTTLNPQPLPPKELSLFELRTVVRGLQYEMPPIGDIPAELLLMEVLGFSPEYEPDGLPADVWGMWYHVYVSTALALGLMGSDVPAPIFAGANFSGDAPMTRAEAAMVLANLLVVVTAEQP